MDKFCIKRKGIRDDKKEIEVDENVFALCHSIDRLRDSIELLIQTMRTKA